LFFNKNLKRALFSSLFELRVTIKCKRLELSNWSHGLGIGYKEKIVKRLGFALVFVSLAVMALTMPVFAQCPDVARVYGDSTISFEVTMPLELFAEEGFALSIVTVKYLRVDGACVAYKEATQDFLLVLVPCPTATPVPTPKPAARYLNVEVQNGSLADVREIEVRFFSQNNLAGTISLSGGRPWTIPVAADSYEVHGSADGQPWKRGYSLVSPSSASGGVRCSIPTDGLNLTFSKKRTAEEKNCPWWDPNCNRR